MLVCRDIEGIDAFCNALPAIVGLIASEFLCFDKNTWGLNQSLSLATVLMVFLFRMLSIAYHKVRLVGIFFK